MVKDQKVRVIIFVHHVVSYPNPHLEVFKTYKYDYVANREKDFFRLMYLIRDNYGLTPSYCNVYDRNNVYVKRVYFYDVYRRLLASVGVS